MEGLDTPDAQKTLNTHFLFIFIKLNLKILNLFIRRFKLLIDLLSSKASVRRDLESYIYNILLAKSKDKYILTPKIDNLN